MLSGLWSLVSFTTLLEIYPRYPQLFLWIKFPHPVDTDVDKLYPQVLSTFSEFINEPCGQLKFKLLTKSRQFSSYPHYPQG